MPPGEITDLHEGWRYKHFVATGLSLSGIESDTVVLSILVPFDHYLRRALMAAHTYTDGGGAADDCRLFRSVNGASAGQIGATLLLPASLVKAEFVLTEAQIETEVLGGGFYYMDVNLDHASDALTAPSLELMIIPIPPGPA